MRKYRTDEDGAPRTAGRDRAVVNKKFSRGEQWTFTFDLWTILDPDKEMKARGIGAPGRGLSPNQEQ